MAIRAKSTYARARDAPLTASAPRGISAATSLPCVTCASATSHTQALRARRIHAQGGRVTEGARVRFMVRRTRIANVKLDSVARIANLVSTSLSASLSSLLFSFPLPPFVSTPICF